MFTVRAPTSARLATSPIPIPIVTSSVPSAQPHIRLRSTRWTAISPTAVSPTTVLPSISPSAKSSRHDGHTRNDRIRALVQARDRDRDRAPAPAPPAPAPAAAALFLARSLLLLELPSLDPSEALAQREELLVGAAVHGAQLGVDGRDGLVEVVEVDWGRVWW
ncbi:hypothetical protein AOQ84DRAFT_351197 [Glonium stellatum]|uniref:Uncharacterized protein n=1 Tax=Glonium stellatum TaxID=574774 RepID=A0A8E2JZS2_9PEZI|nr:hypothetical protein AOQ84DRAFT_351197 [Glonium stellatum]